MSATLERNRPDLPDDRRERFSIDGVSVCDLFDRVYDETQELSSRFNKLVRFDVIAWSALTVAADAEALSESLVQAVRWCVASSDTQLVTVRAYPSHDEVWAVFDVQADLYAAGELFEFIGGEFEECRFHTGPV